MALLILQHDWVVGLNVFSVYVIYAYICHRYRHIFSTKVLMCSVVLKFLFIYKIFSWSLTKLECVQQMLSNCSILAKIQPVGGIHLYYQQESSGIRKNNQHLE